MSTVQIKRYNWDTRTSSIVAEIDTDQIAEALTPKQVAEVLEHALNTGKLSGRSGGKKVGEEVVNFHRTLQGLFIEFVIGCLQGFIAEYRARYGHHTDPRNEGAVNAASRLNEVIVSENIGQSFI
jgi:hypothetical protein